MNFQDMAQAAEAEMRGVFPETPLQKNEHLSAMYDAEIWLKREDLSPVRSYKLRGAFNAMRKVAGETHFVCASAGNHAQGVAYMCRHMNVQGTIFMPVTTPQQKIQKTKMFGGNNIEVRLIGDYFDDCLRPIGWCVRDSIPKFSERLDSERVLQVSTVDAEQIVRSVRERK